MKVWISAFVMVYFVTFFTGSERLPQPEHFDYKRLFYSEPTEIVIEKQKYETLKYQVMLKQYEIEVLNGL